MWYVEYAYNKKQPNIYRFGGFFILYKSLYTLPKFKFLTLKNTIISYQSKPYIRIPTAL